LTEIPTYKAQLGMPKDLALFIIDKFIVGLQGFCTDWHFV